METERIALSQRERDRLHVLHEVQQGRFTQVTAAQRMKLTARQVRRLLLSLSTPGAGDRMDCGTQPQAKGRIERMFETLQDRLVKEMRLAGI